MKNKGNKAKGGGRKSQDEHFNSTGKDKWKNEKKQKKFSKKNYETEEERRFTHELQLKGLYIKYMEADGNCMFRSIADQLVDDPNQHLSYRKKIMEYIESNREHFSLFMEDDEPFDDYLARMNSSGEWGDHQELYAASQCLGTNVVVHQQQDDRPTYVLACPNSEKCINISYHGECHYNSVRALEKVAVSVPNVVHAIKSRKCDLKEKVAESVVWASERDIELALELTHDSLDDAIDFLCTHIHEMGLFHGQDQLGEVAARDCNLEEGIADSKRESEGKVRFSKTKFKEKEKEKERDKEKALKSNASSDSPSSKIPLSKKVRSILYFTRLQ